MSSKVIECLISFAYLGDFEVKEKGISVIDTFCKLLIFCDQWNEKELREKVRKELEMFFKTSSSESSNIREKRKSENEKILKILTGLSNYLIGNDKVLRIIVPLITKFGVKERNVNEFLEDLIVQSMIMKEEKEESEGRLQEELNEKDKLILEKKKLSERILELERMVGEIKVEDDEGVGKGQIRERENDEDDEEIKKEQPKRKKRKINKNYIYRTVAHSNN